MSVAGIIAPHAAAWIRREAEPFDDPGAARFIAAMKEVAQLLSEHPRGGVAGLIPGTRTLIKGDYLVTYRLDLARGRETVRQVQIIALRNHAQGNARRPRG